MTLHEDHVLIVDDEYIIAKGFSLQVEAMGLSVCATAYSADDAIALAKKHRPGIVLMDMRLRGDKDGVDAALAIHKAVGSKMIFVTGSSEPEAMARIQLDHPIAVLIKPVSDRQLQSAIDAARAA